MSLGNISIRSGVAKARLAVGFLIVYGLLTVNMNCSHSPYGSLMFTSPRVNILAVLVTLLLPSVSVLFLTLATLPLRSQPPLRPRVGLWATVAVIPLSLICLVMFAVVAFIKAETLRTDKPTGEFFNRPQFLRNIPIDGSPVRIYNDSDGCLGDDWLWVQQERPVLPGLIWVTELYHEDEANDVTVKVIDRHHIRLTFPANYHRKHTDDIVVINP